MDDLCLIQGGGLHQTQEDLKTKTLGDRKGNTIQYTSAVVMCLPNVNNGRHVYPIIQSYLNHVSIKTYPSLTISVTDLQISMLETSLRVSGSQISRITGVLFTFKGELLS